MGALMAGKTKPHQSWLLPHSNPGAIAILPARLVMMMMMLLLRLIFQIAPLLHKQAAAFWLLLQTFIV